MLRKIQRYTQSVLNNSFPSCPYETCPHCGGKPSEFKRHDMRKRVFLLIKTSLVQTVNSLLVRFKCPLCRKSFTVYPSFALPYNHYIRDYIRDHVVEKSTQYVEDEMAQSANLNSYVSYRKAVKEHSHAVGYDNTPDGNMDERQPAHSTLYRWITSLSNLKTNLGKTLQIIGEAKPTSKIFRDFVPVHPQKYRSDLRRQCLQNVRKILRVDREFRKIFNVSVFPHFATSWL